MELHQIYLLFKNKITISTNFLAFFLLFSSNFFFLDPDPGRKMNADPYGSGSTDLFFVFTALPIVHKFESDIFWSFKFFQYSFHNKFPESINSL